jgi:hypothetical protein
LKGRHENIAHRFPVRVIFSGGSKTYKTWAMSDMALSIATGLESLGAQIMKANDRKPAVKFQLREKAWATTVANLLVWFLYVTT